MPGSGATPRGARRRTGPPGEPRRVAYLYLLPALAVYAVFLLVPIGRAVNISLFDWDGLGAGRWVGLANYARVVSDPRLRDAFGHALVLIVFFAVIPLVVGLALASVLHRGRVRGLSFFRTAVFAPQVVAMVVVGVAWRRILAPDGVLNAALEVVGLGALARPWLGDYAWALPSVGLVGTWFETGLVTVLLLAGMGAIPTELYEAARLDGAGPVREFFAVTLPGVRAQVGIALTLTVIAALKTFDLVYIMTKGGPGRQTTVPSYEVYHQAFELGRVGAASALGVCLTLVIFAISLLITAIADREQT